MPRGDYAELGFLVLAGVSAIFFIEPIKDIYENGITLNNGRASANLRLFNSNSFRFNNQPNVISYDSNHDGILDSTYVRYFAWRPIVGKVQTPAIHQKEYSRLVMLF